MDVRCEKCLTVYEFDDAKVGEQGVTVKCTQCGHLFKVKRRERPADWGAPAWASPKGALDRITKPGIPTLGAAATEPTEPLGWMIRRRGEVVRFRELTTLQQWIVERKVDREDEISRSGEQWKQLGEIAELASFFHIVEQAARVEVTPPRAEAPARQAARVEVAPPRADEPAWQAARVEAAPPRAEDPALATTAPMTAPTWSGPIAMGNPVAGDEPAFARSRVPALSDEPAFLQAPAAADEEEAELSPRRHGGLWLALLVVLVLTGVGGYLAVFQRDALRGLFTHEDGRGKEAYRQGREYFLLDSDQAFRNAVADFNRAHDLMPRAALPLAGLAELDATWAGYLQSDAQRLELKQGGAATAVAALRRQAQTQLEQAKRAIDSALKLDPESPEVNRAMAAYQLAAGAPAPEVERYLSLAVAKRPTDPEAAYLAGALAAHNGQMAEARTQLAQAITLNQQQTQHVLLRAAYLLAQIEAQAGNTAAARQGLQAVLAANGQHERARALLETLTPAASAKVDEKRPVASRPAAPVKPEAPSRPAAPPEVTPPAESYEQLVARADRLGENGHSREARKLYDRALEAEPGGIEAVTGIGYCEIDSEKYSAAVDQFKRALALRPGYGEALIGLAEAYKLRGDRTEAVKWYQAYLDKLPHGSKAALARNNLQSLRPTTPSEPAPTESAPAATAPIGTTAKEPPRHEPTTPEPGPSEPGPSEPAPREPSSAGRNPAAPAPARGEGSVEPPTAAKPDDKPVELPRLPAAEQQPSN